MPDVPKLDYCLPENQERRPTAGEKVIGVFGFILYGIPAFMFDMMVVMGIWSDRPLPPLWIVSIVVLIGTFCNWRAVAAFRQFVR